MTFLAVVVGWVFFRAETFGGAMGILAGMAGVNGVVLPPTSLTEQTWVGPFLVGLGVDIEHTTYFYGGGQTTEILLFLVIVWLLPTSQQLMARFGAALETYPGEVPEWRQSWMLWQPDLRWAIFATALAVSSLFYLYRASEFLYYQF